MINTICIYLYVCIYRVKCFGLWYAFNLPVIHICTHHVHIIWQHCKTQPNVLQVDYLIQYLLFDLHKKMKHFGMTIVKKTSWAYILLFLFISNCKTTVLDVNYDNILSLAIKGLDIIVFYWPIHCKYNHDLSVNICKIERHPVQLG